MSKMDNLRAMREARYEQGRAEAARRADAPAGEKGRSSAARTAARTAAPAAPEASANQEPPVAAETLCGHRSMNGRSCTREAGHAAKNHRYS
jgi:hypothetical protein